MARGAEGDEAADSEVVSREQNSLRELVTQNSEREEEMKTRKLFMVGYISRKGRLVYRRILAEDSLGAKTQLRRDLQAGPGYTAIERGPAKECR